MCFRCINVYILKNLAERMSIHMVVIHPQFVPVLTSQHTIDQGNTLHSLTIHYAHAAVMCYCSQCVSVMCPPAHR